MTLAPTPGREWPEPPRVLVSGGAGFLGSHLCEQLLDLGYAVIALDNLSTGRLENLQTALRNPRFAFLNWDVTRNLVDTAGLTAPLTAIVHLACPASPRAYMQRPIDTLWTGSLGTLNLLEFAARKGVRFLYASTSEVYGEPEVHPQREEYWGSVNPVGPRAVYDESKRFGEAAVTAYRDHRRVNAGIVRIFNTYGPRMQADDGRVIPALLGQAIRNAPLTIHGDGRQTRSFCYVDDLVRGLVQMMRSDHQGPINLGNPEELTIIELAKLILSVTGASSEIELLPSMADDPSRRRPDISAARNLLAWEPAVSLEEGIRRTLLGLRQSLEATADVR